MSGPAQIMLLGDWDRSNGKLTQDELFNYVRGAARRQHVLGEPLPPTWQMQPHAACKRSL